MPEQIERATTIAAISMGVAFGLMPKANLSALAIFAWLTLANQLARRVIVVIAISFLLSSLASPYLQMIGEAAFRFSPTQCALGLADGIPFLPWFRLNSPAVLGGLMIGEFLFGTLLIGNLLLSVGRLPKNVSLQSAAPQTHRSEPVSASSEQVFANQTHLATEPTEASLPANVVNVAASKIETDFLVSNSPQNSQSESLKPSPVQRFAVHAPPIEECEDHQNAVASALSEDYSNMEIHESTIEIIRFRSREEMANLSMEKVRATTPTFEIPKVAQDNNAPYDIAQNSTLIRKPNLMANSQSNALLFANTNMPHEIPSTISHIESLIASQDSVQTPTTVARQNGEEQIIDFQKPVQPEAVASSSDPANAALHSDNSPLQPRDEALRYLLWHLSGDKGGSKIRERAS